MHISKNSVSLDMTITAILIIRLSFVCKCTGLQ